MAAMVVFKEGQKDRHSYRRFQLKDVSVPDDYAAMYEVLKRRFLRALDAPASSNWTRPQLLLIDGGRGHINVALRVLAELEIQDVDVLGIAKPRTERKKGQRFAQDKIIMPSAKDPIRMRESDPVLLFLQRVRDETHNTAIKYQRDVRSRNAIRSELESITGVGASMRNRLLRHFGGVDAVREATVAQLLEVSGVGPQLAERIRDYFQR